MTGSTRLGRYRLVSRVAVGGTAEVFVAVAEGLEGFEKRVVIKRLLPQLARDPEIRAMFLDEARLQARLRHPHVVEVYDVGHEEGAYFFAAERVPGHDLRDILALRPNTGLPLPVALHILMAVADGLHHAHEATADDGSELGLVHRDVSPSNVLIGWNGDIKLTDFGVAKWAAQRSHTRQGTLKGKCAYMSPEQCRGESVDRRSDVWALGILLFEITTGRRPFSAESDFEVMRAIVEGRFAKPSDFMADYPPALGMIVHKALAAHREGRFATAAQFSAALRECAVGADGGSEATTTLLKNLFGDRYGKDEVLVDTISVSADRTATDVASALALPTPSTGRPARRILWGAVMATGALALLLMFSNGPEDPPRMMASQVLPQDGGTRPAVGTGDLRQPGSEDAGAHGPNQKDAPPPPLRVRVKKPRVVTAPPILWDLDSPKPP